MQGIMTHSCISSTLFGREKRKSEKKRHNWWRNTEIDVRKRERKNEREWEWQLSNHLSMLAAAPGVYKLFNVE